MWNIRRNAHPWAWLLTILLAPAARGGDAPEAGPISFLKDVAPVLIDRCVACHNLKKAESKYDLTSFAKLVKGGQAAGEVLIEPGKPGESRLVELIRHDGEPRMPYKQEPLATDSITLIEHWVEQGARYDGDDPAEDWVALLHKRSPVVVPDRYPIAVPISALAFSPDGNEVATSGRHEVNLWKLAGGAPTRRLRGLADRVYDIKYSPDGRWLATAGGDPGRLGSAALWAANPDGGGKPARELIESNDAVFAVAFSPDSKRVAAAGTDRAVRVWEVETGKLVSTIEDHADWIFDVAFSPDGLRLATASRDRSSKVFDLAKKETLATFSGHADTVYAVAFSPDGKTVATGGGDGLVRIWDPADDAKQSASLGGFKGPVFRVRFRDGGKQLVASSADGTVRVFENNAPRLTLSGLNDWVYSLAISPSGNAVAAGGWGGEVRLWDLADGKPSSTFLAAPGLTRPAP